VGAPSPIVPAPRPCNSCPYRRDVPAGVWDASEYEKLPPFDRPTQEQPPTAFMCHQQDGRLCAGWVAVHDMEESLGFRLIATLADLTPDDVERVLFYKTDVPLFATGTEAALNGLSAITNPSPAALRLIARLERKLVARDARR
jgi:hypothetical protein